MRTAFFVFGVVAALTFAAGIASADTQGMVMPDISGQPLNAAAAPGGAVPCAKDFGRIPGDRLADVDTEGIGGTFAYNEATSSVNRFAFGESREDEAAYGADNYATGSAGGGVCPEAMITEDEGGMILDKLLGTTGGSDLP